MFSASICLKLPSGSGEEDENVKKCTDRQTTEHTENERQAFRKALLNVMSCELNSFLMNGYSADKIVIYSNWVK